MATMFEQALKKLGMNYDAPPERGGGKKGEFIWPVQEQKGGSGWFKGGEFYKLPEPEPGPLGKSDSMYRRYVYAEDLQGMGTKYGHDKWWRPGGGGYKKVTLQWSAPLPLKPGETYLIFEDGEVYRELVGDNYLKVETPPLMGQEPPPPKDEWLPLTFEQKNETMYRRLTMSEKPRRISFFEHHSFWIRHQSYAPRYLHVEFGGLVHLHAGVSYTVFEDGTIYDSASGKQIFPEIDHGRFEKITPSRPGITNHARIFFDKEIKGVQFDAELIYHANVEYRFYEDGFVERTDGKPLEWDGPPPKKWQNIPRTPPRKPEHNEWQDLARALKAVEEKKAEIEAAEREAQERADELDYLKGLVNAGELSGPEFVMLLTLEEYQALLKETGLWTPPMDHWTLTDWAFIRKNYADKFMPDEGE